MLKVLVALAFALMACEDPKGLWIDNNCTEMEVEAIYEAVGKMNVLLGEEAIIIGGRARSPNDPTNDDDYSMVTCYRDRTPNGYLGEEDWEEIYVYSASIEKYPDVYGTTVNVVMHELGHYIGFDAHLTDKKSVMYGGIGVPPLTEYSELDIQYLREAYETGKYDKRR